ncbi:MAG: PIG-L family deacetylase [Candidatus Omnitrophica bacterium]|nr:PIG-L family deacetylase [Candidatus Omnitrophota bacterium]
MGKRLIFILLFTLCAVIAAYAAAQPPGRHTEVPEFVTAADRILILAPHPDDEAIGCAGVIQQALAAGAQVKILYLTNGDHNQFAFIVYEKRITLRKGEFIHMGQLRRRESIQAMKFLGLGEENLIFLGYPDYGTFSILSRYWQTEKPYKGLLTRISAVPYKENLSFGAPYTGESILGDLERVLKEYKPNKIFVSHPADVNVDHKSLYLFLQIALADLEKELSSPSIYPYLVHHSGWPLPRRYHPELGLEPPQELINSDIKWIEVLLTPQQLEKKRRAILYYRSQTASSAFYLLAFARKNELFGDYAQVQLNSQVSPEELAAPFSGVSGLYIDSESDPSDYQEAIVQDKGNVSYAATNDFLFIRIEKPERLKHRFSIQAYLFGYSAEIPFAQMPKIRIITKNTKFRVFDRKKMIANKDISLQFGVNTLVLKLPLGLLGNPDFILASIKSYSGTLPISATAFRKISIK